MPILKGSASDFTSTVKGSAEVNAAVGGAVARGGNANPPRAAGAIAAVVTQSAIAKTSGLQPTRFRVLASTPAPAPAPAPAAPTFNSLTLTTTGVSVSVGMLAKYNTNGGLNWSARIGVSATATTSYAIATDRSGNVYVAGDYASTIPVFNQDGTSFGSLAISNNGRYDTFLAKYNSLGTIQWITRIGGVGGDESSYSICTDSGGNVYVGGEYTSETVSVYNSDGSILKTLSRTASYDSYIVKYNTNGIAQWATNITGDSLDSISSITCDNDGNVYISGKSVSNTINIYNQNGSNAGSLQNILGGFAVFIVKFNSSGTLDWRTRIDGSETVTDPKITVDANKNVYITGYYLNSSDIYNQNNSRFGSLPSTGGSVDGFLIKYNSLGTAQWSVRMGGSGWDAGNALDTDNDGNIYVVGYYRANLTVFNQDSSSFGTLTFGGGTNDDAFIIKYNPSGMVQWASRLSATGTDTPTGVSVDSSGNAYVSGHFTSSSLAIFNKNGSQFGSIANTAGSGVDSFIIKYNTDGFVQWTARLGGTSTNDDKLFSVDVDSNGNVYVAGNTQSSTLTIYSQGL